MDWFEKLTGFQETGYEDTRARLQVEGVKMRSLVNGTSYEIEADAPFPIATRDCTLGERVQAQQCVSCQVPDRPNCSIKLLHRNFECSFVSSPAPARRLAAFDSRRPPYTGRALQWRYRDHGLGLRTMRQRLRQCGPGP